MNGEIIDLSLNIYDNAPTMPMDPKCSVTVHSTLDSLGYNISRITLSTHQGTHLDAPYHFFNDGITVDRLDLGKCIGKAFKIDLTCKKPKELITIEDFLPYEKKINEGAFILCHTGWDKVFPDNRYFSDFPNMTKALSDWLAEKKIALVGMDTPTPNAIDWKYMHERLLSTGIVIVEGLANLEQITKNEFLFIGFPLKIEGRDGSPIRATAIENINFVI